MLQTQPTLQSVLSMAYMLPRNEQKQLVQKVHYNLVLNDPEPLIDPDWKSKPTYSVDEAFEKVNKHLDSLYQTEQGTLIDTDFKSKEIRPWSDVYEQLCQEVGQDYGLNDIREA